MFPARIVRSSFARTTRLQPSSIRPFSNAFVVRADDPMSGTNKSHAKDPQNSSYVPETAQENLPKGVEDAVPNKVHDTGKEGSRSHATGESMVPESVQEVAPEAVERALPESIHPTEGKKN
ncbi:hypothetical protein LTR70_003588 [Exophiala xenobiotica]|uniref:Uncharacterized protein n=1 Tax=Lithohypha guttulata TaxID=1690604 RepID=A0ABR0KFZ0_9EURO|nr:hypothetical protein LTR24_003136 [Lithohypha guttulata]KAK5322967.1 hypothetical protein LTR70_003588 [Exophiala xenobiotica]